MSIYVPTPRSFGENTLAYYPFINDFKDYTGNAYHLSDTSPLYRPCSIQRVGGVKCCYVPTSGGLQASKNFSFSVARTFSVWIYENTFSSYREFFPIYLYNSGPKAGEDQILEVGIEYGRFRARWHGTEKTDDTSHNNFFQSVDGYTPNTWNNLVFAQSGTNAKFWVNGSQIGSSNEWEEDFYDSYSFLVSYLGWASNLIIEDKFWSDAEILDYYNSTKSIYGI